MLISLVGGARRENSLDDSFIFPDASKYFAHELPVRFYGRENWGEDGEIVQEWTGIVSTKFLRANAFIRRVKEREKSLKYLICLNTRAVYALKKFATK